MGGISENTFKDIYKWKTRNRTKRFILNDYAAYDLVLRDNQLSIENKIKKLDDLPGVGIPVASTILHFLDPDNIPIVDRRTIEVLMVGEYLDNLKSVGYFRDRVEGYKFFRSIIQNIQKECPTWSLRGIDKALFAYHKINLDNKRCCF